MKTYAEMTESERKEFIDRQAAGWRRPQTEEQRQKQLEASRRRAELWRSRERERRMKNER